MKLYFANTSPYARKARMVLLEKGLEHRVETIFQNPFEDSAALKAANPLGKVPALVTSDGGAIYDSPVICAYLDGMAPENRLIPAGESRWTILTGEALADGILDAAFAIVMERRRDPAQQSAMWLQRWQTGILRSVAAVEANRAAFIGPLSIAQIALGAALGYLDFRLPDIGWRRDHPQLAAWFGAFAERPSMRATDPSTT